MLESIIHYATDTSDATVEKVAFSVLNKMVVVWSAPPPGITATYGDSLDVGFQEVFGRFVLEHLSRLCFEVPSKNTFNSSDAQSRLVWRLRSCFDNQVLAEIAGLQKSIYLMKGDALCSYLENSLLPSLGVAPLAAQEYVRALQRLDLKQFKKFFVVILSDHMFSTDISLVEFCEHVSILAFRRHFFAKILHSIAHMKPHLNGDFNINAMWKLPRATTNERENGQSREIKAIHLG